MYIIIVNIIYSTIILIIIMKQKYQLILPYHSTNIHEASTLNSGSNKCYKELKNSKHYFGTKEFSVLDIDNYKIYNYSINKFNVKPSQSGGQTDELGGNYQVDPTQHNNDNNNDNNDKSLQIGEEQKQTNNVEITLTDVMTKLRNIEHKIDILGNRSSTATESKKVYNDNLNRLNVLKTLENKYSEESESCKLL